MSVPGESNISSAALTGQTAGQLSNLEDALSYDWDNDETGGVFATAEEIAAKKAVEESKRKQEEQEER